MGEPNEGGIDLEGTLAVIRGIRGRAFVAHRPLAHHSGEPLSLSYDNCRRRGIEYKMGNDQWLHSGESSVILSLSLQKTNIRTQSL